MGNTFTKEARPPYAHTPRHGRGSGQADGFHQQSSPYGHPSGSSRHNRGSRPDLSFLGISANERDPTHAEPRRETKQEREARKREKERAARLKERERSMKEEHVDGGFLVTQGVYVGTEDFNKAIVRQLIIERKIAPFWKGLNDFNESWVEHQIVAAVRGMPIPAADEIPPELEYKPIPKPKPESQMLERNLNSLTVPIESRSQSFNSDSSRPTSPFPRSAASSPPSSNLFRGRTKTLATLTTSIKNNSSPDMSPREMKLPHDPFVNGQPIEAYLYKAGAECPICFLYYPPYLNRTRCCDQPICSECFVQIKRPDPHPPEHEPRDANTPQSGNEPESRPDELLVSEPAACPFCVQPEFGVTYAPPPFRRGLAYGPGVSPHPLAVASSAASSSSSVVMPPASNLSVGGTRRRATSLSADAPGVITTDRIRPDWAQKLATARAHALRRSAAATALHAAAYLMNNNNAYEQRPAGSGSRRGMLRRLPAGLDSPASGSNSPHIATLAHLAEQRAIVDRENESGTESPNLIPPRASSRRNHIEQLEEMMLMEAIRLSLAAEAERRAKEEKAAKKEAKRREKEARKADKRSRKGNMYSNNMSTASFNAEASSPHPGLDAGPSRASDNNSPNSDNDKGKGIERSLPISIQPGPASKPESPAPSPLLGAKIAEDQRSISSLHPPSSTELAKRFHFRRLSSASSSNSSLVESALGEQIGSNSPHTGSNASLEPMLNFQSIAGVIDHEDKAQGSSGGQVESPEPGSPLRDCSVVGSTQQGAASQREDLDMKEARANHTEISPNLKPVGTSS